MRWDHPSPRAALAPRVRDAYWRSHVAHVVVQEADNAFYFEPSLTEVTEKLNDEHIDWLEKAAAIKSSSIASFL